MPWHLEVARSEKNGQFFFLPMVNAWLLLIFEGLWLVGTHFRRERQSLTKKTWYGTLFHCSWWSAWYQIMCDTRVFIAWSIRGWRNFGLLLRKRGDLACLWLTFLPFPNPFPQTRMPWVFRKILSFQAARGCIYCPDSARRLQTKELLRRGDLHRSQERGVHANHSNWFDHSF